MTAVSVFFPGPIALLFAAPKNGSICLGFSLVVLLWRAATRTLAPWHQLLYLNTAEFSGKCWGIFGHRVADSQTVPMLHFRDDLQGWGIHKFMALKRYKHTARASEQRGWEVADRKANKTFSSSHFYLPPARLLILFWVLPPATFCAIFSGSM